MPLLSFRRYHLNYPAHPHEEGSSDSSFWVPLLTKLLPLCEVQYFHHIPWKRRTKRLLHFETFQHIYLHYVINCVAFEDTHSKWQWNELKIWLAQQPTTPTTKSDTPLIQKGIKIDFTDISRRWFFFIIPHNASKSADLMRKLDGKWQIYSTAGLRRPQSAALIWQSSSNYKHRSWVLCIGGCPSMSCPRAVGHDTVSWKFMGGCLCNAHSDVLKSSPSLSASSFKLCCTVRQLRVTHSGNHPRCTLQRRCADALWQPPTSPPHKTSQPMTGILYTTFFPQVSLWISSAASTIALTIHSDGHHSCLHRHLSHWYFEVQFKK